LLAAIDGDLATAKIDDENNNRIPSWRAAMRTAFLYGGKKGADVFVSAIKTGQISISDMPHGMRDARLVPFIIQGLDYKEKDPWLSQESYQLLQAYQDDPSAVAALTAHGWHKESDDESEPDLTNASVESLLESLRSKDENQVADAALALGNRREMRAVKPLLELVSTPWLVSRQAAISALGRIGDHSVVPTLVQFLCSDPHFDESFDRRLSAINALADLKAKEAVDPLIEIASDPQSPGRDNALAGLATIGDERSLAAIETIFKTSPDSNLRERAWRVLQPARSEGAAITPAITP
jgi:HEAT repeat protein